MRRARRRAALVTATLVCVAAPTAAFAAAAADPGGTITVGTTSVAVGQTIPVGLDGWPNGLVTITVCGNSAKRGSVDCDLSTTAAVAALSGATSQVNMTIGKPPVPCPCVLRASTQQNDLVRTTPIEIAGIPVEGVPDPPEPLTASVQLTDAPGASFLERARGLLGGPLQRVLRISLRNNTAAPMTTLSLQVYLGDAQGGSPVPVPVVQPLLAGEQRTYDLPVDIAAPSWGRYHVLGSVYGLPTAVPFEATTSTTPWLLVLLVAVLIIDVLAWFVVRRRRRRVPRAPLTGSEPQAAGRRTPREQGRVPPVGAGAHE